MHKVYVKHGKVQAVIMLEQIPKTGDVVVIKDSMFTWKGSGAGSLTDGTYGILLDLDTELFEGEMIKSFVIYPLQEGEGQ